MEHGQIQKLADLVGISRAYMSELISGRKTNPHTKILLRLAALTQTSVAFWLKGTSKAKKEAIAKMEMGDHA